MSLPDGKKFLIKFLSQELSDVRVTGRVPDPRPSTDFLVVLRTGTGPRTRVSDSPMLTLEGWSRTDNGAYDLINSAREVITKKLSGRHDGGIIIYRVEEAGGPAELPPEESGQYRYTYTIQPHMRQRT